MGVLFYLIISVAIVYGCMRLLNEVIPISLKDQENINKPLITLSIVISLMSFLGYFAGPIGILIGAVVNFIAMMRLCGYSFVETLVASIVLGQMASALLAKFGGFLQ